jgi:uncharacterized protein
VTIDPPVIAFGLGVGILIGLTGIAGGSLMTLSGVPCEQHSVPIGGHVKAIAAAIGLGFGVVLGMTSVGSGALVGIALIVVFRLTPHRVVGSDVFHAALMLWAAGLAQLAVGNVDLGLMANILAGSLPGVWVGSALMPYVPPGALRLALGCTLLGSALAMMNTAGADFPTWTIVGMPALVGLLAFATHRSRAPDVRTA